MANLSRQKFIKTCGMVIAGSSLLAACGAEAPLSSPDPTTPVPTSPLTATPATPATTTVPQPSLTVVPSPTIPPAAPTLPPVTASPTSTPGYNLDLAAKVGQRMMVVFPGDSLTPEIAKFLLAVKPGGIVMFADNISSLTQIKKLNSDLQNLAAKNGLLPFIICLDEEGGIVSRLPADGREFIAPSQMAQAAAGLEAVQACARETAIRLSNLGFNLNLAPDADVNSNYENPVIGTRSYGSDPAQVAQAVRVAINEYKAQNIDCCVKHFPGHGDTNVDSHTGLPVVRKSRAEMDRLELVPFVEAIKAGTPFLMSGHIVFPQVEPNSLPATLSPYFLKQVLRQELNYQGIIITDSLSMGAISSKYGLAEAGRLSLKAGADMIIAIGDLADQQAVFNRLLVAAKNGDFEIDPPLARILAYKATYAISSPTRPENPAALLEAAQASITALRSDNKTLPLQAKNPALINLALAKPSQVEGQPASTLLGQLWRERFPNQPLLEISTEPTLAELNRATRVAGTADVIVIVTRDAFANSAQANLVQSLLKLPTPAVVVAVRGPYDLVAFPKATNYLVTYSDTPVSTRALMSALLGTITIKGKLPVSIPNLFEIGAGLVVKTTN